MRTPFAALALTLLGASSSAADDVRMIGDLRQIGSGTLAGTVPLKDLTAKPHLYGCGMVHGLQGEVLILDGKVYLGQTDKVLTAADIAETTMVAFGGYAHVASWDSVPIPDNVTTFKDLQAFVSASLAARKVDPAQPSPFRLEANAVGLRWFVVGGFGNRLPTPKDSFYRQIAKGGLDDVAIAAFGIHSTAHRGIYTNPVSDIHMHFITADGRFAAHLDDDLVLGPGGRLLFPSTGDSPAR
jgi:hypothetical protein